MPVIQNAVKFSLHSGLLPSLIETANFSFNAAPSVPEVEIVFRRDDPDATEVVTFNSQSKAHGGNKSGVGEVVTKVFNFIGSSFNGDEMTVECHFKAGGWGVGDFVSASTATTSPLSVNGLTGLKFTWTVLNPGDTTASVLY